MQAMKSSMRLSAGGERERESDGDGGDGEILFMIKGITQ